MTSKVPDVSSLLVAFGRELRARGLPVGTGQLSRYTTAAALVDITNLADLYWAGRACLVSRREDVPQYDAEFVRFFFGIDAAEFLDPEQGQPEPTGDATGDSPTVRRQDSSSLEQHEDGGGGDEKPEAAGTEASITETLRYRSFSDWTSEEFARISDLIAALRIRLPLKQTRRTHPSSLGTRLDLRRTVRRSLRHEGELLERAWRARRYEPRRVVMLMDVSGSMSAHSRALLHFAYALSVSGIQVEVFCFGTRLTRITNFLNQQDPDRAVDLASAAIADWAGGTRIGESLAAFMRDWAGRGVVRGAVVLVVSDGLERGDPEILRKQASRLARLAHVVVWLNPLKGDPAYQPLARGMKAALPYVDHLVAADTLDDLERVARLIPRLV